jgi:hypothetical protein
VKILVMKKDKVPKKDKQKSTKEFQGKEGNHYQ